MKSFRTNPFSGQRGNEGAALVFAFVIAIVIAGLAMSLLVMNLGTEKVRDQTTNSQKSFYAAEAGLSDAFVQVQAGLIDLSGNPPFWVGAPAAPVSLGEMQYWVEIDRLSSRNYSLAATGINDGVQERVGLVMAQKADGFFQYAAFGSDGVKLDSNSFIDSYDSELGDYASQVGANNHALQGGNVGSNFDIVMDSNTNVHGDAIPGPTGILDDSAPGTYVSGSTDPATDPFPLPPIAVPSIPSSGVVLGTTDMTVGPGAIHYDSFLMRSGILTIEGPATVVVDRLLMRSGTELHFDTTNGPVNVYGTADFVLESNSTVVTNSDSALDVTLWLSGNNRTRPGDRIELNSNADFVGAVYAPDAFFRLASNFQIFGSIMCGELDLSSNGVIHFDEALLYDGRGATGEYEPTLWRRLPNE